MYLSSLIRKYDDVESFYDINYQFVELFNLSVIRPFLYKNCNSKEHKTLKNNALQRPSLLAARQSLDTKYPESLPDFHNKLSKPIGKKGVLVSNSSIRCLAL
tara:strand:+ start:1618 stop:1923 length:306 start_codon:yes stop_codon:yes gene_type:complete